MQKGVRECEKALDERNCQVVKLSAEYVELQAKLGKMSDEFWL